ncbi:MAG TPA: hypothetical protein DCY54_05645, partial [Parachlamydiales bacterium]|nr:hypothetical protein [Parachlamydiales bacterium]
MFKEIKRSFKRAFSVLCVALATVVLSYQLMQKKKSCVEKKYHRAHLLLEKWKKGDEKGFDKLTAMLKKQPSFHETFDALIVEHFMDLKRAQDARKFLHSSLEKRELPLHRQFSSTSLLISEGELLLALAEAKALQAELLQTANPKQEVLSAFNLWRIALLEKQAGTPKGEQEALNALEA